MRGTLKSMAAIAAAGVALVLASGDSEAKTRFNFYIAPYFEPAYPIYLEEPVFVPRPRAYYYDYAPRAYGYPPQYFAYAPDPRDPPEYDFDEQYYEPRYEVPPPAVRTPAKPAAKAPVPAAKPAEKTKKAPAAISCAKASKVVSDYGFKDVKSLDCKGQIYAFNATRDGKKFAIKLNAANGELTEVKKL